MKLLTPHSLFISFSMFDQSEESVANLMKRPFYMDSTRAKEFGFIDKVVLI